MLCWADEACTRVRVFFFISQDILLVTLASVRKKAGLQGITEMLLLPYTCRRYAVQAVPLQGGKKTAVVPYSSKKESPAF